ncbi:MAG: hypothetical protein J7623_10760 [Chitinophaga sp.]|uniref:hypothetical protein n=1 Tax=Chitinophaga sp. TaxID=1869181 RepID=UPI001B2A540A|nr:hypothetical protein [Chitinophaga sp.]MBO9729104.1 hypothetical protein [Chitinophaga sp.]
MNKVTAFIITTLLTGIIMTGCKKDQNPRLPDDTKSAALPLVKADKGSSTTISDIATFQGKFSVGLYFADKEQPKKMDVVVALNKVYTNVKVLKADVTTYPTSFTVTAQQLADLFGAKADTLPNGTTFEIGANVFMSNGLMVPIFNPYGSSYGPDASSYTGSSLKVTYKIDR